MTNRDLYLFVADLVARKKDSEQSLEDYLRCFLRLVGAHRNAPGLAPEVFATILERSFDDPPGDGAEDRAGGAQGFGQLVAVLAQQICDLREMDEAGTLRDEMRYFGKNAPSGSRWYNFDPCTFIECATAGTFRGWREGDPTSREYVPGEVAVPGEDGSIEAVDPRSIEDPVEDLGLLDWDRIVHFIEMGQFYE